MQFGKESECCWRLVPVTGCRMPLLSHEVPPTPIASLPQTGKVVLSGFGVKSTLVHENNWPLRQMYYSSRVYTTGLGVKSTLVSGCRFVLRKPGVFHANNGRDAGTQTSRFPLQQRHDEAHYRTARHPGARGHLPDHEQTRRRVKRSGPVHTGRITPHKRQRQK